MPKENMINHTKEDLTGIVQIIRELENACNRFMCENEELIEQKAELENQIEALESRHQKDLNTVEEQESQKEHLQKENKDLQCEIEAKEMEISKQKAVACDVEDIRRENERLSKDVKSRKRKLVELKNAVRKVEKTMEEKKEVEAKLENRINRVQAKMNEYEKAKGVLKNENDCVRRRNAEAKKAIEATAKNERLLGETKAAETARQKLEEVNRKCATSVKQMKRELAKEQRIGYKQQNKDRGICEDLAKTKKEMQLLREEKKALNEKLDEIAFNTFLLA